LPDKIKTRIKNRNSKREQFDKSKTSMSIDYIFGSKTSRKIEFSKISFVHSRRTGRIRYLTDKTTGNILFSFRPNGTIAPTVAGASLLVSRKNNSSKSSSREWEVTVIDGVSEVVAKGKTVFCKHVVFCSDSLRPGEDVSIMNEKGELLAVGKTVLGGPTVKQFKRGQAVKIREGSS
jgi:uncharacterized protein with predicted RNA binding PUA domain